MGTGASTDGNGGGTQTMKPTRPSSAQVGTNGARKRMLVSGNKNRAMTPNASSRAGGGAGASGKSSPNGKRSGARGVNGYSTAGGPAVTTRGGTGAARVATKHRLKLQQEDDLKVLTRNADPLSLEVLEMIEASDKLPDDQPAEKLQLLQQCYPMLEKVPVEDFDQLAMAIYQKEGEIYQQQGEKASAKETYTRAITLAERRVARGDKDMYNVLKRYVMAMIGVARIWYEEERDTRGFEFVDRTHPRVAAMDAEADNVSDASSSLSSLESTFSSVGSVFSLNQAILKSMAPRPPRRRTGPNIGTIKVKAPHQIPSAQLATREDEFVLYSKMTRELVASPCELLLLRCCEVVEIGLHTQSELLIPPLIELAQLYEDLALYSRALLVVRRCLGILCNVYDYDHPWVIELRGLADYLDALRQEQLRNEAATKIQSVWRMYKAMQDLEEALGRPVHRHYWIPKKYRQTPDIDFLGDLADAIPADDDNDRALPGEERDDASQPRYTPPRHVSPPGNQYPSESPNRSEPRDVEEPNLAPVLYDPVRSVGDVATFTTMVPNAKVLGTTQDTQTDTHVQPTDKGDVLTVRTTTITKTITEKLPGSDEDEETPETPEEPCDVPIPCCPRCARDLPVPHCDRCLRELPPPPLPEDLDEVAAGGCPRCPYCRVHRPGMTRACPHCSATLPASRRWPASGAAPDARDEPLEICERCHQSVPLDVCAACQRDVPPPPYAGEETYQLDPDGSPRCPFCRTVQPALRCPDCDATPEEEPLAAEEEQAPRELPEEVPVPHCPRCDRELEEPQCPCCERAVPPPPPPGEDTQESLSRCPFCRVHQPVHRCFNCHRDVPLVRPEEAPADDHRAQHQLQFCPFCGLQAVQEHCPACHREQPPAPFAGEEDYASDPSKPPRCPYCRTVQPALRCPDCDATPEEEPLAAEEEQAPRELPEEVPVPHCPRCDRELEEPQCPCCERAVPPPPPPGEDTQESLSRCPFCRVHQPVHRCFNCHRDVPLVRPEEAPEDDHRAQHQLQFCPFCGLQAVQEHCPACHREQPPAPFAGEEDYASDPSKPPRCPYCRTVQPALRCPDCDATPEEEPLAAEEEQAPRELPEEVPVPHCPRCDRELEEPQCPCCERAVPPPPPPGEDTQESLSRCPFCRVHQPVHRCFNCHRDVPLVRPEEAPEDDHRAQHQLQFCPFCGLQAVQEHCPACHREQPPAPFAGEEDYASDPSKPPRCPYCRTVQPALRCPDCDATPEEEPLAAEEEQAPRELPEEVPVPHCPRCDRELEEPQCPCCERAVPPPPPPGEDTQESLSRCPFCRVHQPVHRCFNCHRDVPLVRPEEAPEDDHRAQHQLQFCPFCGLQAAQEHCPACHREQPPAPFAGEEDYASDPSKPPRCPYCRTVQPALRCPDCDATPEEEPLAAEEERMPPVEAALPVERGLSMSPTPPPSEPKMEEVNEEAPEPTPVPHCPRCHHELEVPHCPACTMELPPPPPPGEDTQESLSRCPFCRVHQPVHRCFSCCRTLPLVRPEEAPADDHRAQHQLQFCPFCGLQAVQEHCPACHHEQPPAPFAGEEDYASDPSKPPRCPYCRTVQPALRCPYCDVPAAEPEAEVAVDPTGSDEGGEEEEVLCPNCGLQELEFPPDCPYCRRALPAEIVPTEPHTEENPTDEPAPLCPFCNKVLPLACPRCDAPLPATAGATPVERELPVAAAVPAKMSPSSSRAAQTSPPPPPATMTSCSVQTVTEPAVPAQDAATMTLPEPKPEPPRKRDAQTATTPPLDVQPRAVAPPAPRPATASSSPSASERESYADDDEEGEDAGSSAYTVVSSHSSVRYEQYPGGAVPQPPQAAMPQMPGMFPGMYPGMPGAGNHYYYVYYPVGGTAMPMMMGAPGMMMPPQPPQQPQPQPQPQPPMGHSRHHRYRRSSRSARRGSKSVTSQLGPNTSGSTTLSELRFPCPSCHRTLPPLRCPECARRQPEPDENFLYDPENPPHCRACGADQPIAHCPYCFIELARVMDASMPTTTTNNKTSSQARKPAPPPLPRRSSAHTHAPDGHRDDDARPPYQPEPPRAQPQLTQEARVYNQASNTAVSQQQQQQNVYTSTPLRVGTPPKSHLVMRNGPGGTTVYQETTDTPGGFRIVREYTIERTRIDRTTHGDKHEKDNDDDDDDGEEEEDYEQEEEERTDEEDITDAEEDEEVLEMLAELRAREELDPVLSPYRGASTSASMLPSMTATGTTHGHAGASASLLPSIAVPGGAHAHAGASSSRMWNNVSSPSLSGAAHPDAGLDEAITTTTRDVQRIPNGKRTIVQSITRRRSQLEQPSTVFDVNPPGTSFMYGFPNVASSGAGISLPTLSRRTSHSGSLQKPTVPTASRAEQDNVHMYDEL